MSALLRAPQHDETTSAVAAQLEVARRQVEDRFRAAGTLLSEVLAVVKRLAEGLTSLTEAIQGDGVERTTADLLAAADHLSSIPDLQSVRRARLGAIQAAGALLRPKIEEMRLSLQYLRIFVFNIKIAAAGAGASEFKDFADEMAARVEFGVGELAEFDRQLAELSRGIAMALQSEGPLERQCAALLPGVRRDLAGDAEALREHHNAVAATAERVAALTQGVQMKVGRALGGLQIGDITRQRIEHVQSALEMVERFQGVAALGDGGDRGRLARAVHRMLAAQMADVVEQFQRDAARVTESLSGMASDTDQILALRDLTYSRAQGGDAGFLRSLERSVADAKTLVSAVQAASREADAIARSTSSTAEDLAGRVAAVQQVRSDIHMMALNTALRCCHMGEAGRPLAVVAAELRSCAEVLDASAGATATALDGLAVDAAANPGGGASFDADAVLEGAIDQIRVAGDEADASLRGLAEQSGQVADVLTRTERQLDFSQDLAAAMETAREALAALGGADDDPTLDGRVGELTPLFDEIAALYTMAREREIHRLAGPAFPESEPAAHAAPSKTADELEDVLF